MDTIFLHWITWYIKMQSGFDIVPVGDNFQNKSGPDNSDNNNKKHMPII